MGHVCAEINIEGIATQARPRDAVIKLTEDRGNYCEWIAVLTMDRLIRLFGSALVSKNMFRNAQDSEKHLVDRTMARKQKRGLEPRFSYSYGGVDGTQKIFCKWRKRYKLRSRMRGLPQKLPS